MKGSLNDPPILAPKQPKMAIFEEKKTDYWGLKDSLEIRGILIRKSF